MYSLAIVVFTVCAGAGWRWFGAGVAAGREAGLGERTTGFLSRSFTDDAGDVHRYVLFVPHSRDGRGSGDKFPVIMFLNGFGENGGDGVRQISNNFGIQVWEMREFFPFIVIAPQCRERGTWNADSLDTKWAFQILDSGRGPGWVGVRP